MPRPKGTGLYKTSLCPAITIDSGKPCPNKAMTAHSGTCSASHHLLLQQYDMPEWRLYNDIWKDVAVKRTETARNVLLGQLKRVRTFIQAKLPLLREEVELIEVQASVARVNALLGEPSPEEEEKTTTDEEYEVLKDDEMLEDEPAEGDVANMVQQIEMLGMNGV
jgi:hypothetical protein